MKEQLKKKLYYIAFSLLLMGLAIGQVQATDFYVKTGVTSGAGTSFASAFGTFQEALDVATVGDKIYIAAGTYKPSVGVDLDATGTIEAREVTFQIPDGVEVYGGFEGTETGAISQAILDARDFTTHTSILSGDIGAPSDNTDNAYHVVYTRNVTVTTVVDGFTIMAGNANGTSNGGFLNSNGAGWLNQGDGFGNSSTPTLRNIVFFQNTADFGGGMYNYGFLGTSSPILTNCTFSQNTAIRSGAGIYNYGYRGTSSPILTNCNFSQNNAIRYGGGMYNYGGGSGGDSSPVLTNCTFSQNTADFNGGGMFNNGTDGANGNSTPQIVNSIFWGNKTNGNSTSWINDVATPTVSYSLIEEATLPTGTTDGGNNVFNQDPLFVDAANEDLKLQDCSPAINTGNNADIPTGITTDLAGKARTLDVTVDMGAYENPQSEINLQSNNTSIVSGDTSPSNTDGTDFGGIPYGDKTVTYTIQNTGSLALSINGIISNNAKFVVSSVPSTVPASGTATFDITYKSTTAVTDVATITVTNSDCDEGVYTFAVQGSGVQNALNFDGTDDYVNIPYNASLDITGALTLEAWVKTNNTADFNNILIKGNYGYGFTIDNNAQLGYWSSNTNYFDNCPKFGSIPSGTWTHVAVVVVENTSTTFYINGVEVGQAISAGETTINSGGTDPLVIGRQGSLSTNYFGGSMDEVRIWNTARTCSEIKANMNNELTGEESGLVAYYNFNKGTAGGDNTGLITLNDGVSSNNGTLNSFALSGTASNWVVGSTAVTSDTPSLTSEINIQSNSLDILSGDTSPSNTDGTDFGATLTNKVVTYTIENTGSADLIVSSIGISGTHPADFAVGGITFPATIAPAASTTFTLTFTPGDLGLRTSTVTVNNSDCDEGAYTFNVQAVAATAQAYVRTAANGGSDSNTGADFSNAFATLQQALGVSAAGTKIYVAAGTYIPTQQYDFSTGATISGIPRAVSFKIPDGVEVYGGFAGTETGTIDQAVLDARDFTTNTTILSGDLNGDDNVTGTFPSFMYGNYAENAYHVVYTKNVSAATIIDGVTITAGNANGGSQNIYAGGWYNDGSGTGNSSNPTLRNIIFSRNTSSFFGGGMYNSGVAGESSPTLTNCSFSQNTSLFGGGLLNNGDDGISSPTITNCIFSQNTALSKGGGIYLIGDNLGNGFGSSAARIINSVFEKNTSHIGYNDGIVNKEPHFINCTFTEATIAAVSIFDWNSGQTPIKFKNCIFWNNTAMKEGAGGTATLAVTNSIIEDVTYAGTGTINQDPLFVDAANGDLTLQDCSPAINAGKNADIPAGITTDLAGNARTLDVMVDMGAYENPQSEINLQGNNTSIVSGDTSPSTADDTAIGNVAVGDSKVITYTIENTGSKALAVSEINITGTQSSEFVVGGITLPLSIAANSSASFTLTFTAAASGVRSALVTVVSDDCDEASYTFEVQAYPIPSIAMNATDVICIGDGTATANAGSGTYDFLWSNSFAETDVTSSTATNLGPGEYSVTVTDALGFSVQATVLVENGPTVPVVDVDQLSNVTCPGASDGSIIVSAGGGGTAPYTYTWSDIGSSGATNSPVTRNNLSTGSYSVTITDALGCQSVKEFTIATVPAEINLLGNSTSIVSGASSPSTADDTDFGNVELAATKDVTYTIENTGSKALEVASITITGTHASQFVAAGITLPLSIAANSSATFTLSFTAGNLGASSALVTLASDDCDEASYTFAVQGTGLDTTLPTAICQAVTVQLDVDGNTSITAEQIDDGSTDNGGIATLALDQTTFTAADLGEQTVTLTVTDASGNEATCTAVVTVEDIIAPTAICQAITVQLDADGNATITAEQINNGSTDNLGIPTLALDQTTFTAADLGEQTVTLTVTDASGNQATCTAVVTVEDIIAPTTICQAITVQLDADGNATITAEQINNGSTDNVGIATLALDQTTFTAADLGEQTVTLTVTDASGNEATCTAVVTVEDIIAPTAICQAITVQLDADGNASITAEQINNGSTDNGGIATLALDQTTFTAADLGEQTVTLTVTDASGNEATCTAVVTVEGSEDTVNPIAVCQPITIQLDNAGNVSITAEQIDNGSTDNVAIASLSIDITSFDCSQVGENNVTLTVTDTNGNTASCVAVVTVEDALAPTVITQDISVALDENGQANITAADIDNGSTDNCGIATRSLDITTFDNPTTESSTVTLTVVDLNGNSASATAVVSFQKLPQQIIFEALADKKVGDEPVVLIATGGDSGLPVTFSLATQPATGVATLVNNEVVLEGPGLVTITASQAGNTIFEAAAVVSQSFTIAGGALFLPELFSPNNDGINDHFILRGGEGIESLVFQIFDKEGNLVFETNSITDLSQNGWDGTSSGKALSLGVYLWVLKGSLKSGGPLLINGKNTGIVMLVR
ncbi:choice-of-anchor D domain-containing protein [Marivirga salinae]|uniref:Choice-of-anchor D domain-containing protein n=1 Tax=Marivirga salinarum TaxID=3059078 RepID=A0AA51NCI2_9BACT|nr:choice-of-anchor D domain-containing protein [Marivirga sp. BDSF4-3]WMN11066.1 choice-of-anchor D domain-containing protein [Marivirga sp. BDSF4-3]